MPSYQPLNPSAIPPSPPRCCARHTGTLSLPQAANPPQGGIPSASPPFSSSRSACHNLQQASKLHATVDVKMQLPPCNNTPQLINSSRNTQATHTHATTMSAYMHACVNNCCSSCCTAASVHVKHPGANELRQKSILGPKLHNSCHAHINQRAYDHLPFHITSPTAPNAPAKHAKTTGPWQLRLCKQRPPHCAKPRLTWGVGQNDAGA